MKIIGRILHLIDDVIEKIAGYGLIVSVFFMLTLSVLTIVLRWFNITYLWFDPFVRHLVFLSAFLGGVVATGRGTHIGIDILGKYLERKHEAKAMQFVKRIISLVSFLVLIWLIVASSQLLKVEIEYGRPSFLGIHSALLVGIIPFGFALIGYRFFYLFIASFMDEEGA